jgi:hypothetical protein
MLFIVSSDVSKADPATRKLIRSHAMKGVKKKRRRAVSPQEESPSTTLSPGPPVRLDDEAETSAPAVLGEVDDRFTPLLPGCIASDLSFLMFADEMEPAMLLNILKGL